MPGDAFLTSLASDRRNRAIAVVLSGSNNPHSALQLLRQILVTKTRQFDDTTDRNSLIAVTQN